MLDTGAHRCKQSVGAGKPEAAELQSQQMMFEGNIDFYGKSGFRQASEYGIRYHGLPKVEEFDKQFS